MYEFVMYVGSNFDAYKLHQKVWAGVRKLIGDGAHFLFREAGGYVKVRHSAGEIGRPCLIPETGKQYRFDVLINPMRSDDGKKLPLSSVEEALALVRRHLEKNGFSVLSVDGTFLRGKMFGKPRMKDFRFRTFLAYGEVLVVDREKAIAAMKNGIGASKRFGFGMIELEEAK